MLVTTSCKEHHFCSIFADQHNHHGWVCQLPSVLCLDWQVATPTTFTLLHHLQNIFKCISLFHCNRVGSDAIIHSNRMCVYSVHFYHSTFKSSVFSKRGRSWGWVQIGTHGHSWTWPQKPLSGVESITGSGSKSQATKPAGSTPPKPHSCSQNTATGAVVLSWHSQRWMSNYAGTMWNSTDMLWLINPIRDSDL